MGIDKELQRLLRRADKKLDSLRLESQKVVEQYEKDFDAILAKYGKTRCPMCSGTGAVARLDAGYMKRFGLREWNGCAVCGSANEEEKGRGYI